MRQRPKDQNPEDCRRVKSRWTGSRCVELFNGDGSTYVWGEQEVNGSRRKRCSSRGARLAQCLTQGASSCGLGQMRGSENVTLVKRHCHHIVSSVSSPSSMHQSHTVLPYHPYAWGDGSGSSARRRLLDYGTSPAFPFLIIPLSHGVSHWHLLSRLRSG
jgi:hypothetical protein